MSGFYIGLDGKARKVKGGYIGIDGKARKIKKGYIGVDGVARLCWTSFEVDPVFANNSWEKIVLACQLNEVPDSWAVGDQKTMTIGGTDYAIDIIGKDHDDYADGSGKAPVTFQFHTYGLSGSMNSLDTNQGGWESSNRRLQSMPSILEKIPSGVKDAIREVIKTTSSGGKNSQLIHSVDKLFLLSEVEVFGATDNSFVGEGTQYEYYKDEFNRIKSYNGTTTQWWQRSPDKNNATNFCATHTSGTASSEFSSSFNQIIPAFCF